MAATNSITAIAPPKTFSWKEALYLPVLFFKTLAEPFTPPNAFALYRKQIVDVKQEIQSKGVRGYIWKAICEKPLDVVSKLSLFCTAGVGLAGNHSGGVLVVASTVLKTVDVFGTQIVWLQKAASSVKGDTLVKKSIKATLYGGIVYLIASFPIAAAEWDSLAQAKAHYKHPCPPSMGNSMKPAGECLEQVGAKIETCRALLPADATHVVSLFSRHTTKNPELDPVSITKWDESRVCFYTALDAQSSVTKLCFRDMKNLDNRIVSKASSMPLAQAHAGLQPGDTIVLLEVTKPEKHPTTCASFIPLQSDNTTPPTACVLTALEQGGPVSQICFNPDRPEVMTLKSLPSVQLQQPGQTEPVSILILNPHEMGLNVAPDVPCPAQPQGGLSLWGALKMWWTGKSPCDRDLPKSAAEKDL